MLKRIVTTTLFALSLLTLSAPVRGDDLAERFSKQVFQTESGEKLPYRLLEPRSPCSGTYPLVVFLHGAGERGDDNVKPLIHGVKTFATDEYRKKFPCFVIAPQCPTGKRWVEVDWSKDSHTMPEKPSDPMRLTLALIESLKSEFPIDPNRVYITGLSMGGYGSWDAIQRHPELFAAAAPVCGGGDPAGAERMVDIPVWAFHGDKDTAVKPHRSRDMIAAIEKAGGKPKYTEYPGVGHNSWVKAYSTPELYEWMFAQKKTDKPAK